MKCLLISLIVFVAVDNSDTNKPLFLPQLPVGEYRLNFLGMMSCASTKKIQFNWYLSKKSATITEIKGNLTNTVPLDDSLDIEVNLAIKDSIGGWKDNAVFFKLPKACSSLRNMLGNAWTKTMNGLGVSNSTCPIPVGMFKSLGMDTNFSNFANFPKSLFYGTYKTHSKYTKNNVVYGCNIIVIQVKRPWEND